MSQVHETAPGDRFPGGRNTDRSRGVAVKTSIYPATWIMAAIFLVSPAHALTCGTTLTTSTILTADLVCNNTDGLIIDADNVTLDLNGHVISCVSSTGYLGSCQPAYNQSPTTSGIQ